jgi:deoxyribonuclease V
MAVKRRYPQLNVANLIEQQRRMAEKVLERPFSGEIRVIAGADAAFSNDERYCIAAIVSFSWPELEVMETVEARKAVNFPYIPGLLSFREAPAVLAAAGKMSRKPDILLIDGQGRAHPRRFGLACHVGLELGWPTIGCAKSRLIGEHRAVGRKKGSQCRLMDDGELIGKVVRSREDVKCLYISVGHLMELDEAVGVVLRCCRKYRLPEPTRQAHNLVSQLRR